MRCGVLKIFGRMIKTPAMKPPPPPKTEKNLGKDLQTHEELPAKIKDLELLQHQAEKATGEESIALNKIIAEKSKAKDQAAEQS